eukprot:gene9868-biopygen11052
MLLGSTPASSMTSPKLPDQLIGAIDRVPFPRAIAAPLDLAVRSALTGHWLEPLSGCRIRVGPNVLDRGYYSRTRIGYELIRGHESATNGFEDTNRLRMDSRTGIVDRNRGQESWTGVVDRNRGQESWTGIVDRNRGQGSWTGIVDGIVDGTIGIHRRSRAELVSAVPFVPANWPRRPRQCARAHDSIVSAERLGEGGEVLYLQRWKNGWRRLGKAGEGGEKAGEGGEKAGEGGEEAGEGGKRLENVGRRLEKVGAGWERWGRGWRRWGKAGGMWGEGWRRRGEGWRRLGDGWRRRLTFVFLSNVCIGGANEKRFMWRRLGRTGVECLERSRRASGVRCPVDHKVRAGHPGAQRGRSAIAALRPRRDRVRRRDHVAPQPAVHRGDGLCLRGVGEAAL